MDKELYEEMKERNFSQGGDAMRMCYEFFVDRKNSPLTYDEFSNLFSIYLDFALPHGLGIVGRNPSHYLEMTTKYFDEKYNIASRAL